ncbi:hypothetical protein ACJA23_02410 [Mycoplasma corogypsi]|uniref:hypothetical protein n=1 Tax=Mycoplasma corogypsi TaxID=2106 RepID=UPI003872C435
MLSLLGGGKQPKDPNFENENQGMPVIELQLYDNKYWRLQGSGNYKPDNKNIGITLKNEKLNEKIKFDLPTKLTESNSGKRKRKILSGVVFDKAEKTWTIHYSFSDAPEKKYTQKIKLVSA